MDYMGTYIFYDLHLHPWHHYDIHVNMCVPACDTRIQCTCTITVQIFTNLISVIDISCPGDLILIILWLHYLTLHAGLCMPTLTPTHTVIDFFVHVPTCTFSWHMCM